MGFEILRACRLLGFLAAFDLEFDDLADLFLLFGDELGEEELPIFEGCILAAFGEYTGFAEDGDGGDF